LNAMIPSGGLEALGWHVVASDFPADWLPNFQIWDTVNFYSNSTLSLWNGTTGATHSSMFAGGGSRFDFIFTETGTTSYGTHWVEINLQDAGGTNSKNIWFFITRDLASIGDSIYGMSRLCVGGAISLTDPFPGGTWSSAGANATVAGGSVTGISAGTDVISYTATFMLHTFGDSCTVHETATKTVTVNSSPTPVVSGYGGYLYTGTTYTAYQWLNVSTPILGATNSYYNPTANGTYAVTVTDVDGCYGTSGSIFDANVSVPQVTAGNSDISIYPNPAHSVINIAAATPVKATLVTVTGRTLIDQTDAHKMDLTEIPAGIYLLSVYDNATGIKLRTIQVTKLDK
jgi:hypothetical protein